MRRALATAAVIMAGALLASGHSIGSRSRLMGMDRPSPPPPPTSAGYGLNAKDYGAIGDGVGRHVHTTDVHGAGSLDRSRTSS